MQPYPTPNSGSTSQRGYGAMPDEFRVWPRGVSGGVPLASWPWRVAAGAIDYVPAVLLWQILVSNQYAGLGWAVLLAWLGFNSVYMQGMTSQSLGKRITGIRLAAGVMQNDGQYMVYPGVGLCLGRLVAHVLDLFFFPFCIGLFRPLWQHEYRTFADSIAKTWVTSREWNGTLERRATNAQPMARLWNRRTLIRWV
jgi:hypothetical protein